MKGICYIVGAGEIDEINLEPDENDYVIAADAGYLYLPRLTAVADLLIGDFDSLPQKPKHPNIIEHPREKDQTDMALAIEEGLKRGYRTFVLLGGMGGRLDHTYANIQTLAYLASKKARGYLLGSGLAITVIRNGSIRFDGEKTGIVSVFCCGETAQGVTIRGLKYPLENAVLKNTLPIGVSNAFIGEKSEISVLNGSLAVMWADSAAKVIDNLKETCYSAP